MCFGFSRWKKKAFNPPDKNKNSGKQCGALIWYGTGGAQFRGVKLCSDAVCLCGVQCIALPAAAVWHHERLSFFCARDVHVLKVAWMRLQRLLLNVVNVFSLTLAFYLCWFHSPLQISLSGVHLGRLSCWTKRVLIINGCLRRRLSASIIKIQLIISRRVFVEGTRAMLTGKENGRLDHVSYNVQHGESGTQQRANCLGQGHWPDNQASMHVLMVGETRVPRGNPLKHGESLQRKAGPCCHLSLTDFKMSSLLLSTDGL